MPQAIYNHSGNKSACDTIHYPLSTLHYPLSTILMASFYVTGIVTK
ncbi:MAG: hypothetical protein LBE12_07170 [Planctomycetaceae bacterium]|nr:hypothetical protein [Planctomycetaceae bacterium]